MKALGKILAAGFLIFLVLSVIEESDAFKPLVGLEAEAPPPPAPPEDAVVEQALRELHALVNHLYASGGDLRFAERLPAAPGFVDELLAELAYLRDNGRTQRMSLMKLELAEVRALGPDRAEVLAKEYWVIHTVGPDGQPLDPPRSTLGWYRYLLTREGGRWTVMGWDLGEAPEGEGG